MLPRMDKKPRIDPALKSTPKEKAAPSEPDDYPDGAVRRRGDENDQQEP